MLIKPLNNIGKVNRQNNVINFFMVFPLFSLLFLRDFLIYKKWGEFSQVSLVFSPLIGLQGKQDDILTYT